MPFTTTDYPGKLAAVLFLQGCPWHCAYCHNPHLQAGRSEHEHDWPQTLRWLERRRGLLDAIVFSGGEPTAQPALASAMRSVRRMGFAVGLHSGGAYPRRLAAVLPDIDWIGFDFKAPFGAYPALTGKVHSGAAACSSLDALLASGVRHEIRTTVHPALTTSADLVAMADALAARGVTAWVLQPFRPNGCANQALAAAAAGVALDPALLARLARRIPGLSIR